MESNTNLLKNNTISLENLENFLKNNNISQEKFMILLLSQAIKEQNAIVLKYNKQKKLRSERNKRFYLKHKDKILAKSKLKNAIFKEVMKQRQ